MEKTPGTSLVLLLLQIFGPASPTEPWRRGGPRSRETLGLTEITQLTMQTQEEWLLFKSNLEDLMGTQN